VLLSREAADLRRTFGEQLSEGAVELLGRIASFVDARTRMLDQWDRTIERWLEGTDDLPHGVAQWRESYHGRGDHAPTLDAMPEPFIGDWVAPKFVVLGLNPGMADLGFQGRSGHFATEVANSGYSDWAKTNPYASDPWVSAKGLNRYGHARLKFAERWLGEPVSGDELLIVELYPWHSKSWDGSQFDPRACRDALREFVWDPLGEVRLDQIFAFGKSWLGVADRLELEKVKEFDRGEFHTSGRAGAVFELSSSRKQLIVLWQRGPANPPGERDTARLKDLLRSAHTAVDKPVS
jgi:hypothetical protein